MKILSGSVIVLLTILTLLVISSTTSSADPPAQAREHIPVCLPDGKNSPRCHARVVVDKGGKPQATTSPTGYGPAQFLGAYNLSGNTSTNQTIAIVDAFDHPNIKADLNTYSTQYGIATIGDCPVSSGTTSSPCFQKVDQRGGTSYPSVDSSWALEIALDVEVVRAACQNCNILLVEADSNSVTDLMSAIDRARLMGAKIISNSWGTTSEFPAEINYDSYFNYAGIVFTVSSGDGGYGTNYPSASRFVTAVGGTTLNVNSDNTYNSETVWSGTGSGCSSYEGKPNWQKDNGCSRRTVADVAADADPNTGASVYDSVLYNGQTGWYQVGGTSLSAPLVAGVYALAGVVPAGAWGNSLPYTQGNSTNLHDILNGNNGRCRRTIPYLCTAKPGYDGPTGLGTPKGPSAF